jgi:hypothetical protein
LIGDISGGDPSRIFGKRPDVAPFVPVDLSAETAKAVSANLENFDSITALLDKYIPGFSDMLQQGTTNALSELQGKLPQDVQDQVQRSSAFAALQGGFGGTAMGHALTARDLGLTSLNLTQLGGNAAQLWSQYAETGYGPFTISTGQQAGTTAANNAGTQATQQFQFNVDAAPDPATAGLFMLDQHIGDQFMSFGLGAAGGAIAGVGSSLPKTNAPTGTGTWLYNPATGQYTPTAASTTSGANYTVQPTWGQIGGAG